MGIPITKELQHLSLLAVSVLLIVSLLYVVSELGTAGGFSVFDTSAVAVSEQPVTIPWTIGIAVLGMVIIWFLVDVHARKLRM